jgi:transcriptional regulator of arginine metabolism
MSSRDRQRAILDLIRTGEYSTQAELAQALRAHGSEAVQTTISRDIKDLGLVKVRAQSGRLVYAPPHAADLDRLHRLRTALSEWALGFEPTGNLLVITTPSGYANALARAFDESDHPLLAGTIAGDNTIFVAARDGVSGAQLRDELLTHLERGVA